MTGEPPHRHRSDSRIPSVGYLSLPRSSSSARSPEPLGPLSISFAGKSIDRSNRRFFFFVDAAYELGFHSCGSLAVFLAFAPALQLYEQAPDVEPVGGELHGLLGHSPQESFPAFVDERPISKVDNACSSAAVTVRCFPTCSQLKDPRPDQLALQNPSLFGWRLIDSDAHHA